MHNKIISGQTSIAVVGLGYVGLPIALAYAKHVNVIGFDIKESRIDMMKKRIDPSNEISPEEFLNKNITFTANPEDLKKASFFIIAVPTPIDDHKLPDLEPLFLATEIVGKQMKKGDYIVYESTVYPGCTEEDCVPLLEKYSKLRFITDFKVGYSPERVNPGDTEHSISKIIKVVSGCDHQSCEVIAKVYQIIVQAGVYKASSIKVAEAAKIIENAQRDINIAFMNELSMLFEKMEINTYEVLDAASTKWNFLKFTPGLVGGHCIGVDPYYLTYKAKEFDFHTRIINSGRALNDEMSYYIARQVIKKMLSVKINLITAKVLVMGITFKENVSDIRNSKVVDLINELKSFMVNVDVVDPYASSDDVRIEYGFYLNEQIRNDYDAVIVAVKHDGYQNLNEQYFESITNKNSLIVDLKGMYRGKIKKLAYWSL